MKKRIISLILVLSMCCALLFGAVPASASDEDFPFRDVREGAWYRSAVEYVWSNKLMNGISKTAFDPDGIMTRAMLVTVLWRANGSPEGFENHFTDVETNKWYTRAVAWAAAKGYVNGVGNDRFDPNSPVSREQFVTILYRMSDCVVKLPKLDRSYMDTYCISGWAENAIRWALGQGILKGNKHTDEPNVLYLDPKESTTRAQAAAILMREQQQRAVITADDLTVSVTSDYHRPEYYWEAPELSAKSLESISDFSIDLFRESINGEENTVISPVSVLYVLAMLTNGADGATKKQLEQAIGMSTEEMNVALRDFAATLVTGKENVNLANAIWVRNGFKVKKQFLQTNADYYQAAIYQAPFDNTTVKEINDWVSHQTNDLIPSILDEFSEGAVLALVNAVLFEGKWENEYDNTKQQPFYCADGTTKDVQMLKSTEQIYLEDDNAIGFRKSFASGRYSFAVIVPKEGVEFVDYVNTLNGAALQKLLKGVIVDEVHASMPKFKAETFTNLNDVLLNLGIQDLLDADYADLSGIAQGLYVSKVVHRAVVDLDEKGVSAAAATAAEVAEGAADEPKNPVIKTVTADRPYLYMIVDNRTMLPLFIGRNMNLE